MLERFFSGFAKRAAARREGEARATVPQAASPADEALRRWLARDAYPGFYEEAGLAASPLRMAAVRWMASPTNAAELAALLGGLREQAKVDALDRLLLADLLLRVGQVEEGERELAALAAAGGKQGAQAGAVLGMRLFDRGEFGRARTLIERACALYPELACCRVAGAILHGYDGRHEEGVELLKRARAAHPYANNVIGAQVEVLLRSGRLLEGMQALVDNEYMMGVYPAPAVCPAWEGEALGRGRLVMLTGYGLGDVIQMLRFVRLLREREPEARVSIVSPPELARLARSMGCFEEVHEQPVPFTGFDWMAGQNQLPLALGAGMREVSRFDPYLAIPPGEVAAAAAWLPPRRPGVRRVGVRWAGRAGQFYDRKRSIPFEAFQRLFAVPGVEWVALVEEREVLESLPAHPLLDVSEHMRDLFATGALISNLDLVITADTSVAHLGGALGLPTWVATRPDLGWRWGETGPATPWYKSVRVFRHVPGTFDWDALVADMESALREWLQQAPGSGDGAGGRD
ncbi:MAG: O-linked N-acetylglucosamine transferase [Betaproteobacteria bacterium]|nr:O-linked N-acetylglucosamine transferase [Betaproteobacteria bacterium]